LAPAGGGAFRLAVNADSSNLALGAIWPADLSFDTTYRAIVSYNATDAVGRLWLNPVSEISDSITHTGTLTGTLIDRIILRQNDDYDGKQIVDNLVVASTFAEALNGVPTGGLAGDYNKNGAVDVADFVVWREAQSSGATALDNRDPLQGTNPVGSPDYDYWRARFGNTAGTGTVAPTAVPEPAGLLPLSFGTMWWAAQRYRSRRLRRIK